MAQAVRLVKRHDLQRVMPRAVVHADRGGVKNETGRELTVVYKSNGVLQSAAEARGEGVVESIARLVVGKRGLKAAEKNREFSRNVSSFVWR